MSDIEDYGDDAIWVPATPEGIEATRRDARESGAMIRAAMDQMDAEEIRNGTYKPHVPRTFTQAELGAMDETEPPY